MFEIKFAERIKTNILSPVTFFPPENRVVYQIMSKNMVKPERSQMTIWRRDACWIIKAKRAPAHDSARAPTHHVRTYTPALALAHRHLEMFKTSCFPRQR
jgi:hypothetical protein